MSNQSETKKKKGFIGKLIKLILFLIVLWVIVFATYAFSTGKFDNAVYTAQGVVGLNDDQGSTIGDMAANIFKPDSQNQDFSENNPDTSIVLEDTNPSEAVSATIDIPDSSKVVNYKGGIDAKFGFAPLVDQALPAVVSIEVTVKYESQFNSGLQLNPLEEELLKKFGFKNAPNGMGGNQPKQEVKGAGSGFIVSPDGYIVTNYHVVRNADSVSVTLSNGKSADAEIYAFDKYTDLAVLKINVKDKLTALRFADSANVKVGSWVLAIGNPSGLEGSVSVGIVSAIGRDINIGPYTEFLQTDAAINPGNSGGPLVNMDGQVVGMSTAILSQTGGSIGIGFAIPANTVQSIVAQLIKNKSVSHGWVGVQLQPLTDDLVENLGTKNNKGALIASVLDDSPASKAGLLAGDVVTAVNNVDIKSVQSLMANLAAIKPGTKIVLTIYRSGKEMDIPLVIEKRPTDEALGLTDPKAAGNSSANKPMSGELVGLGLRVQSIKDSERTALKMKPEDAGVLISGIRSSFAQYYRGKIRPGAVLVSINKQNVTSVENAQQIIDGIKDGGQVLLRIKYSNGANLFVALKKQKQL